MRYANFYISIMENSVLLTEIMKNCDERDNKKYLECTTAFKIAEKYNINIIEIGKICNKNNIKINNCQLGCF